MIRANFAWVLAHAAYRSAQLMQGRLTIELLEHALDGAGAAATAHGNVELVGVRHFVGCKSGAKL